MKKMKIAGAAFLLCAAVIAVLLYNKSRMEARSRSALVGPVPVSVSPVTRRSVAGTHSLVGTVAANNDVAITAETQGRVVRVFTSVGDRVSAGSPIVQVDDELKQAAYTTAEVNYEKAKKDLARYESLFRQNSATGQQAEGARLAAKAAEAQYIVARRQLRDTKITSPISGVVTARAVDEGTMVFDKMVVANVVDISRLKVKLNVAERDVFRLHPGDSVAVTTDVYPGVTFAGTVETIGSKGDEAHTYPVEVALGNSKEHPLKAGMFAVATFTSLSNREALTVPREALVGSLKKPQIFVAGNGVAKLRDIVVGTETGTALEVLSGVREGESVVVSGQNNLKNDAAVTIVK